MALLLLEVPGIRQRYGMFPVLPANAVASGDAGQAVEPYPVVSISQSLQNNPAVVTLVSPGLTTHGLSPGDVVIFRPPRPNIDSLPPEITENIPYYVLPGPAWTPQTFQISDGAGNAVVTTTSGTDTIEKNPLLGRGMINSPLLWLAQRIAKNRERLGVHYMSDSMGSRHFAAAIWRALLHDNTINCPTLISVLRHAEAEWPTKWP